MTWKDFKIKTKLRISFAIIIIAFSIFGTLAIVRLQKINQKAKNLAEQELPFVISITQMERNWHHAVLFYQNYKNSRKPVDYFQSSSFLADAEKSLNEIQNSKFNHDQTQEDLLFIASLFKKFKALTDHEFKNTNSNNVYAEYNTIDQINVRCKEITEREIWRSAQESQLTAQSAKASIYYLFAGLVFILLISIFVSNRLSITLLRPIKLVIQHAQRLAEGKIVPIDKSHRKDEFGILIEAIRLSNQKFQTVIKELLTLSEKMNKISQSLDLKAESLTENTSDQATNTEALTTNMRQVNHLVEANSMGAKQTAGLIDHFSKSMAENVINIHNAIEVLNNLISKSAAIKEIAFHTNILSLNASIEAAKAGLHGREFSVVAQGVRQLAEQTSLLSDELSKISTNGIEISGTVQQQLTVIEKEMSHSLAMVDKIAISSDEQKRKINEVSNNINMLNIGVKRTAKESESISKEAANLIIEAQRIRKTLGFFDLDQKFLNPNIKPKFKMVNKSKIRQIRPIIQMTAVN